MRQQGSINAGIIDPMTHTTVSIGLDVEGLTRWN